MGTQKAEETKEVPKRSFGGNEEQKQPATQSSGAPRFGNSNKDSGSGFSRGGAAPTTTTSNSNT